MKYKILKFGILALLICSCSVQKKSTKTKQNILEKKDLISETFRTITERFEGEQLNTDILPVDQRKKDAFGNLKDFFTTQKKGNLKKTIHYKKDGNVSVKVKQIDMKRVIVESVKIKDKGVISTENKVKGKQKTESVSGSLYIYLAFLLYIIIKEYNAFKKKKLQ